jgi:hypothetical protein
MSKAKKPAAKKPKAAKQVVFVVMRTGFDVSSYRGALPQIYPVTGSHVDLVAEVPVRGFATRKAATAYARQLDDEVRATFPAALLTEACGRNESGKLLPQVARRASELGLPPIKLGKEKYNHPTQFREWWAKHAADLSAEQKAALSEALAGMTFHHVKEIELEG